MKSRKAILDQTENQQPKSNDSYYEGIDDFIKREGTTLLSQELTEEELAIAKTSLRYRNNLRAKQCYYNSQCMILGDETNLIEYWEGYKTESNFPFLHGFNVINGKVIDITPIPSRKKIFGVFDENIEYTGVKFDKKMIFERILTGENCTSFIDNWEEGYPLFKSKWKK